MVLDVQPNRRTESVTNAKVQATVTASKQETLSRGLQMAVACLRSSCTCICAQNTYQGSIYINETGGSKQQIIFCEPPSELEILNMEHCPCLEGN